MAAAQPAGTAAEVRGHRAAVRFVLSTMFLNAMAFGVIIPVVPDLVMALSHSNIAHATAIGGWLSLTFAAMQFVFSPVIGNLSDRFGRRPVLLGSLFGFACDFLIMALAPTLGWLFLARVLSGLFGSTNAPAQAVLADITPADDRARLYGLISAAFGAGFVMGPAVGGLLGEIDYRWPFYASAILAFANFIYGWLALPETLAPENRRPFDWRRANPVGALIKLRQMPGLTPITIIYFLWQLASLIYPMTWAYFAIGRFGWSNALVGVSLALMGIAMAIAQSLFARRAIARFGERRMAEIGLVGAITIMVILTFNQNGWVALAVMPLIAISSFIHPCLTAMMTRRASRTTQGEVQGIASSSMAVGSVIAPLLYNPLLAWFTSANAPVHFYGIGFAVASLIAISALVGLLRLPRAQ